MYTDGVLPSVSEVPSPAPAASDEDDPFDGSLSALSGSPLSLD
jgi:hypothetical protein